MNPFLFKIAAEIDLRLKNATAAPFQTTTDVKNGSLNGLQSCIYTHLATLSRSRSLMRVDGTFLFLHRKGAGKSLSTREMFRGR